MKEIKKNKFLLRFSSKMDDTEFKKDIKVNFYGLLVASISITQSMR